MRVNEKSKNFHHFDDLNTRTPSSARFMVEIHEIIKLLKLQINKTMIELSFLVHKKIKGCLLFQKVIK